MRLGKLARQLNISPAELEARLQGRVADQEINHNTRLDRDTLRFLVMAYAPERLEEILQEPEEVVTRPSNNEPPATDGAPLQGAGEEAHTESADSPVELPDVIRAPKVELPGLRVVGKIELPEPPKKELPAVPTEESGAPAQPPVPARGPERFRERRQRSSSRPQRDDNPIARERQRQERVARQKREEEARQKKEMRTRAYVNQQLRRQAGSKSNGKTRPKPDIGSGSGAPRPKPKTWLGRLWRWLAHGE